jgi:hypothetical protein
MTDEEIRLLYTWQFNGLPDHIRYLLEYDYTNKIWDITDNFIDLVKRKTYDFTFTYDQTWFMGVYPLLTGIRNIAYDFFPVRIADIRVFVGGNALIENLNVMSVALYDMEGFDDRIRVNVGTEKLIEAFIPLVEPDAEDASSVRMFVDDVGTIKAFQQYIKK